MFQHNIASFMANAVATTCASIVECAVNLCNPILHHYGALDSITIFYVIELLLSGPLPQSASGKVPRENPPSLEGHAKVGGSRDVAHKILRRGHVCLLGLGHRPICCLTAHWMSYQATCAKTSMKQ